MNVDNARSRIKCPYSSINWCDTIRSEKSLTTGHLWTFNSTGRAISRSNRVLSIYRRIWTINKLTFCVKMTSTPIFRLFVWTEIKLYKNPHTYTQGYQNCFVAILIRVYLKKKLKIDRTSISHVIFDIYTIYCIYTRPYIHQFDCPSWCNNQCLLYASSNIFFINIHF